MNYQVCPANIHIHKDAIIKLWRENLPKLTEERFEWFYNKNPKGQPQTWLVKKGDAEEIVGCCSIYPRSILVDGQELKVGIASDFAMNKEHRVLGPAILLQRATVESYIDNGYAFLMAWPNAASEAVFKRVRYKNIGQSQRWAKIIKTRGKITAYVKNKHLVFLGSIGGDFCIRLKDYFTAIRLGIDQKKYVCSIFSKETTERFNFVANTSHAGNISCIRDVDYIRWRYLTNPIGHYQIFSLSSPGKKVVSAFIIFISKNGFVDIVDVYAEDMKMANDLFALFIAFRRREKTSSISVSFFGDSGFIDILSRFGFQKRESTRKVFIHAPKDVKFKIGEPDKDNTKWLIFDGDLDV